MIIQWFEIKTYNFFLVFTISLHLLWCEPFSSFPIYIYQDKVSWFHFFLLLFFGWWWFTDSVPFYCKRCCYFHYCFWLFLCPPVEKGKNKHGNGLTFVVFSETAVWERWKIQEKPMSFINLEVLLASWEMSNSMGSTLLWG